MLSCQKAATNSCRKKDEETANKIGRIFYDVDGMPKPPTQVTGRQYKQCPHCKARMRSTRAHIHIRRCPVLHPKPPQPPKSKPKKAKKPRAQRNHPPIIPDPLERKVIAVLRLKPKSRLIRTTALTIVDLQERPRRRRKGANRRAWHSPLEPERAATGETFRRCRFCRKPAMPGSDLCYTCESD